ncbi:MAG: NAD-dependent epimerase/dehydratase family protein [Anaerolineae bacterium]
MILVTGATGFLGRNLCQRLLNQGYPLKALVRPGSDTDFLAKAEVAYGDVTDYDSVLAAVHGCESIIHAAAVFRFWGSRQLFEQTNVLGAEHMLRAALAAGVKRFVYVSTVAVVGPPPDNIVIDETTPCHPADDYQRTKLRAEQLALRFYRDQQLPVIVLRLGALYGPWGHYALNRLFFEEFLRGWRIQVEHGRHITFPCFVGDAAQAIEAALHRGRPGEIYNVSGPSISHRRFNRIISRLAGRRNWRLNMPTWVMLNAARLLEWLSRWTGREPYYPLNLAPYVFKDWRVDSSKAGRELGFCPTPVEEGVRQTLDWYRSIGLL